MTYYPDVPDFECMQHECTNDAQVVVSPDDEHHAVLLCHRCYREGYNGDGSLSIGNRVLICTEWEGWFFLPDADEQLQELARKAGKP